MELALACGGDEHKQPICILSVVPRVTLAWPFDAVEGSLLIESNTLNVDRVARDSLPLLAFASCESGDMELVELVEVAELARVEVTLEQVYI